MKAIVLSSGGVDSTTCLAMAVHELGKENVVTLSFEYGQRHCKELESAQKVADYYGVRHVVFNLTQIFSFSNCSLLSTSTEKPVHESYAEQISKNGEGKVSTYVPFRNGLMLSAGAALAQSLFPEEKCEIWIGARRRGGQCLCRLFRRI